jgi:glycosyltransferase involved in cell wall biosynthesis
MSAGMNYRSCRRDVGCRTARSCAINRHSIGRRACIRTSTHEGFCLPVLEAQNLRIPVITSDIPILREVAGEGALYFDLQDPATLAHCLLRMFCDPDLRRRMALASQRNALRFHGRAQLPKPKPFSRSC